MDMIQFGEMLSPENQEWLGSQPIPEQKRIFDQWMSRTGGGGATDDEKPPWVAANELVDSMRS
ncbi:hypothetical protein HII36_35470 [Nonomuraea sp. NN258]|uniref:hypothetical protein n=1 Tax=Nonomuraea antri TaxID=2730852 RepID=UPI001569F70C|nr:hypothetical protein [Nonomuraea antri]NRQ37099.1 hypothetical protein [Nonomuraea antri]